MKKNWISAVSACAFIAFSAPAFAEEAPTQGAAPTEAKAEGKTGRKKREVMCKECGKKEKNCDCKGEGHRKGEEHDASKAEDKK